MSDGAALAGGRYRKLFLRLWRNVEFQALDRDSQIVALYLLTGPQTNRVGLFRVSPGAAAEDLAMTNERFLECVQHVCTAFEWSFDSRARVLWIPSWFKFNAPTENANNIRGALADLEDAPPSPLIARFCEHLRFVPAVHHELFRAAAQRYGVRTPSRHRPDGEGNGVGTQERDQEKETKQEMEREQETAPGGAGPSQPPAVEAFVQAWNTHTTEPLPRCLEVSTARRRKIAARLKERPLEAWGLVFDRIEASTFLRGENDRGWRASFDWVIKSGENATKVLEGKYDGNHTPAADGLTPRGRRNVEAAQRYLGKAASA